MLCHAAAGTLLPGLRLTKQKSPSQTVAKSKNRRGILMPGRDERGIWKGRKVVNVYLFKPTFIQYFPGTPIRFLFAEILQSKYSGAIMRQLIYER